LNEGKNNIERENNLINENEEEFYRVIPSSKINLPSNREFTSLNKRRIADEVVKIVNYEGALHQKEVLNRLCDSMMIGRAGSRIQNHFQGALKLGYSEALFYVKGDFVYPNKKKEVSLRNRSELPNSSKRIEYIPPEEIQLSLIKEITNAFTIQEDEAISMALKNFGIKRSAAKAISIVSKEVKTLIRDNKIVKVENTLSIK
jgi:hypothetical protein